MCGNKLIQGMSALIGRYCRALADYHPLPGLKLICRDKLSYVAGSMRRCENEVMELDVSVPLGFPPIGRRARFLVDSLCRHGVRLSAHLPKLLRKVGNWMR